jgi:hypothetical protein
MEKPDPGANRQGGRDGESHEETIRDPDQKFIDSVRISKTKQDVKP